MILLAAAFLAGDSWTWEVTLRYSDPVEGLLETDRERWTVQIKEKAAVVAERLFIGSVVDDGSLIPGTVTEPEPAKGVVAEDGTLDLKSEWADRILAKALKRLLKPEKKLEERIPGWPILTHALLSDPSARLPGMSNPVRLSVEATLISAKLGGQTIKLPTPGKSS